MKYQIPSIFFLLLIPIAVFPQVFRSGDPTSDKCVALAIVNIELPEYRFQEDNPVSKSMIIGFSEKSKEVEVYFLDDRYDFSLHSIQYGDTLVLNFSSQTTERQKRVIALRNITLQKRIEILMSKYIDVDFWDVKRRIDSLPVLDDGLIVKWLVAKKRFLQHITIDNQGYHEINIGDEKDLLFSERLFGQLYSIYISGHNDTNRRRETVEIQK